MTVDAPVLLAAGGTGGHLFPAVALAAALSRQGVPTALATDERAVKYGGDFGAIYQIASATPTGGSVVDKAKAALVLGGGVVSAITVLRRIKPRVVVAFGGYPVVPPGLAASILGIPLILHEQNAVMGRANRFLAGRATIVATGFKKLDGASEAIRAKAHYVGNPIRPAVLVAAQTPYPTRTIDAPFRLLVTGGSQGARIMSDVTPEAIKLLPAEAQARLQITQQARGEDETRVRVAYEAMGVQADVAPFFADLPALMAQSHLIMGRSGASTVSELAAIGRPALLVPFPYALDADQAANAAQLTEAGAAEMVRQADFTPQWLAERLMAALRDPESLARRAASAKANGVTDAADRLADLVLSCARR